MPKCFVEDTSLFQNFLILKVFFKKRSYHDFVENFLLQSTEPFRRETLLCLKKLLVLENFFNKMGYHQSFWFLIHSAETFRRGTFQCFRNFLVPNFLSGREAIATLSKTFCLTVPINSSRNPCLFQKVSVIDKFNGKKARYHDFALNIFCPTVTKQFVEIPFFGSTNFWFWKAFSIGWGIMSFLNFFKLQCQNIS